MRRVLTLAVVLTVIVVSAGLALVLRRAPEVPEGLVPIEASELRAPLATWLQEVWLSPDVRPLEALREVAAEHFPGLEVRAGDEPGARRPPMVVATLRAPSERDREDAPSLRLGWVLRAGDPEQLRRSQAVVGGLMARSKGALARDVLTGRSWNAEALRRARVQAWPEGGPVPWRSFVSFEEPGPRLQARGLRAFGLPDVYLEVPVGEAVTPHLQTLRAAVEALVIGSADARALKLARASDAGGPELSEVRLLPSR